jgi:hypothetical protein
LNHILNYPFTTGLGIVSAVGFGFASWRLYQSYQAFRPLARAVEDTGLGQTRARPNDVRPRQVGDYRPPPSTPGRYPPIPPPAHDLVQRDAAAGIRGQRRRGVNDELRVNARHRPASMVVGLMARHRENAAAREEEEGTEGGSHGSGGVDDLHFRDEDAQRLYRWQEGQFREMTARVNHLIQAIYSC